jgi:glycosyltransferase involved in cell wall biosynthesis
VVIPKVERHPATQTAVSGAPSAESPSLAPIVLFVYNRLEHTRQTIEALRCNPEARQSELFVYSDGPRGEADAGTVQDLRTYFSQLDGFSRITVIQRPQNMGLARSVIAGVSEVLDRFDRVIVFEDDLVCSPDYLAYMNRALTHFRDDPRVFSVTGYHPPVQLPADYPHDVYLFYRCMSWGWGTWGDRWRRVDWSVSDYERFSRDWRAVRRFARGGDDLPQMLELQVKGRINSWAIRWCYAHFRHDAFCVYPATSRIQNIGMDGSGTHCGTSSDFDVDLATGDRPVTFPSALELDSRVVALRRRFHGWSRWRRMKYRIKSTLGHYGLIGY